MIEPQLENSLIIDLKVEVAMLKKEVSFINILFEKMDVVINKIDAQHDLLIDKTTRADTAILFTKEELATLYTAIEKSEKDIAERINSIEKLLSDEMQLINTDLTSRLDKQEIVTSGLSNIKVIIFGAFAAITFIATNLDTIKKLFN